RHGESACWIRWFRNLGLTPPANSIKLMKLKTVINFICVSLLLAAAGPVAHAQRATPLERLAALTDYVAADYAGAVRDGKILAASESEEQRGLIAEARTIAATLSPSPGHEPARPALDAEVQKLVGDVDAKAPEAVVAADCRAVNKRLIDDYGLVLAP